jgi:hypothetical protein
MSTKRLSKAQQFVVEMMRKSNYTLVVMEDRLGDMDYAYLQHRVHGHFMHRINVRTAISLINAGIVELWYISKGLGKRAYTLSSMGLQVAL